jgi:hypothetical protein
MPPSNKNLLPTSGEICTFDNVDHELKIGVKEFTGDVISGLRRSIACGRVVKTAINAYWKIACNFEAVLNRLKVYFEHKCRKNVEYKKIIFAVLRVLFFVHNDVFKLQKFFSLIVLYTRTYVWQYLHLPVGVQVKRYSCPVASVNR